MPVLRVICLIFSRGGADLNHPDLVGLITKSIIMQGIIGGLFSACFEGNLSNFQ